MRTLAAISLSFAAAVFAAALLPWSGWTWWAAIVCGVLGLAAVLLRRRLPDQLRLRAAVILFSLCGGLLYFGGTIQGELCTPTGAALLRHFVTRFGDLPVMTLEAVGYGMGRKDFPRANCLRAMLGETAAESGDVVELACNLDDMTGEGIAFAMERLLAAGALDVYTAAIGMKKSRPGVMLCVLCREEQREDMVHLLLRHTTTLGVRETRHRRYTLSRSQDTVDSPWGPVARKTSQGWGVRRQKPEFEDLARIAREQDLTLDQVRDGLK